MNLLNNCQVKIEALRLVIRKLSENFIIALADLNHLSLSKIKSLKKKEMFIILLVTYHIKTNCIN